MTFTYDYEIVQLETNTVADNPDTVVHVFFKITGTDANGASGSFMGGKRWTDPINPDGEFVQFENLTKDIVVSWIQQEIQNTAGYSEHIDEMIQNDINRQQINISPVPWKSHQSVTG